MREIIRLEDIRRDFIVGSETVHALRGVSFTITEGEFVTVMGSSGSGTWTPPLRENTGSTAYPSGPWTRTGGRPCATAR